jgi:hypothetical protein
MEARTEKQKRFQIQKLEERIAPTANLNPGVNNTNLPGDQPGSGGGNNNPGENNTLNPGNETP